MIDSCVRSIADGFVKFLSEIGVHYASIMPKSPLATEYFCKCIAPDGLYLSPTDDAEIQNIINNIKPKNSTVIDKISSNFPKQICLYLLP